MLQELKESLGHIFGLDLKTPAKDKRREREINSPVIKVHDDGATEIITGSGGLFYQSYQDLYQTLNSERQLVLQFRKMATCPEVSNAIEEIINDAIVYPKNKQYPVQLDLQYIEFSDNIKNRITDAFDYILSLLAFDEKAHIWFRNWYIDGRLPFYILPFESGQRWYGNTKRGIKDLIYIDPLDIKKIREIETETAPEDPEVNIVKDIEEYFMYFANQNIDRHFIGKEQVTVTMNNDIYSGIKLSEDAVVYATSGYQDDLGNILSYLYDAIKPTNQLNSLEESMLIYRISRAPSRRVFYVDIGNLPTSKAEQYLTSLIARYKNKVSYDSDKGMISSDTIQRSMIEDYWLPRREGSKGTEISTISGSDTFNNMNEELEYFKNKLYTALKVPMSRLREDNTFSFGKSGEITRQEVKFAKFIDKLRRRFVHQLFDQLLKTECVMESILTEREWNEIVEPNMVYVFEEDSYFAELKEIDVLANRVGLLQTITEYVPTYFSQDFVRRHILYQTDEEIKELEQQRNKEIEQAEKEDKIYNDVSGDKKLSIDLTGDFDSDDVIPVSNGPGIATDTSVGTSKSSGRGSNNSSSGDSSTTSVKKSTTIVQGDM